MNKETVEQIRNDLAHHVLWGGFVNDPETGFDLDLGCILDSEADKGVEFADQLADVLTQKHEEASEFRYRVTQWLTGLISKHITDEMIEEYYEQCDRDAAIERLVEERMNREAA